MLLAHIEAENLRIHALLLRAVICQRNEQSFEVGIRSTKNGNRPTTNGNIYTTNGSILSQGITSSATIAGIIVATLSCTCTSGKPIAPTSAGVHVGMDTNSVGGLEICSSTIQCIDCAAPNSDYKGTLIYNDTSSDFN